MKCPAASNGVFCLTSILLCIYNNVCATTSLDRDHAFIGYSERTSVRCTDKLPDCMERAVGNGCLYEAFHMRLLCPYSCNIKRCSTQGKRFRHRGFATSQGTAAYQSMMEDLFMIGKGHWRNSTGNVVQPGVTKSGLILGSVGTGTYLGDSRRRTDEAMESAIIYAASHGLNVIDTASNYRSGRSEAVLGHALDALLSGGKASDFFVTPEPPPAVPLAAYRGTAPQPPFPSSPTPPEYLKLRTRQRDITRDMLFLSTKAGFVDRHIVEPLLRSGILSSSDVVEGMHCIHPLCLQASLNQSLLRMNVESVDLLYLHNVAEVQLNVVGREVFMKRLLEAFKYLEDCRMEGLIKHYGLATWDCFRVPPSDPMYLPLSSVVQLAKAAAGGGEPGLKFIQLPVSVGMPEAFAQRGWQSVTALESKGISSSVKNTNLTLLEVAGELKVGVFGSGPFMEGDIFPKALGALDGVLELSTQMNTAVKLLQLTRSVPGLVATLVGHKEREHVEENTSVLQYSILDGTEFASAHAAVSNEMKKISTLA
ncbi:hypothetical protein CEUSTIGMA_g7348.t1 [Chlamydomonas eustigma]|uniref:NADP-dependent oxidoreductase domain-containing protein n=1 Tax=Chlamydomonas eustigma TaxID=1157962 RepID=A0A250X9Z9_9CHLO|nr:hypothetical protein CEUSTIGMA_g7348.t1 [Chlamydomonas eustigma]|eukprot:GAX79908.1 hypothetical protein CEUSTIGMA_g7348.t1 [Chlamydomonas eustigma]